MLERDDVHAKLEALGAHLERGAQAMIERNPDWRVAFVRQGSLFWFAFGDRTAPRTDSAIAPDAADLYRRFFSSCIRDQVYLAPSAYEVGFLSAAHTIADVDHALGIFERALADTFAS